MIPQRFHFCSFTISPEKGGKPFVYANYLCLLSVIKAHPDAEFNFYYNQSIKSQWFEKLKPFLNLIEVEPPSEIFGIPIIRVEHQSDIVRLQQLILKGGIYLDTDVFIIKPLYELLEHQFVMGIENGMGLCNGVMLSERDSPFAKEWLQSYHPDCKKKGAGFNPKGWGEMSVRFPEILAKDYGDYVTILPCSAFFQPSGSARGLEILFDSLDYFCEESFANHLWASQAWEKYLKDMTPQLVLEKPGYFYKLVRQTLSRQEITGHLTLA